MHTNEKILIARIKYARPDEKTEETYVCHSVYLKVDEAEGREWLFNYEEGALKKPKLYARLAEAGVLIDEAKEQKRVNSKENKEHDKARRDFNETHGKQRPYGVEPEAWTEGEFHIDMWGNVEIRTPYGEKGEGVKKHEVRKALAIEWLKSQGIVDYDMTCSMEFPQNECSRISSDAQRQAKQIIQTVM